ncbi:hypothetical protein [Micromonospora viridifaciens]|uniref:hypothetical protein n=1 Tax=Micromonospora viridifaciens TaxID=1881 RepID=UPI0012FDCF71|nr:hypothetical protein [Micromonospora viridifaciens]
MLRAVVVPVLDSGGTLAQEGMADWPPPQLLAEDARLLVEAAIGPAAAITVSLQLRPVVQAVPGLWQQFFGSIDVRPPGGSVARNIDVQPTTKQASAILTTYRDVARKLTDEDARPSFEAVSRSRASTLAGVAPLPTPQAGTGTPSHRRLDFHLATSILREHSSVLRALGLIVEVAVPAAGFTRLPDRGVIRVSWPAAPAEIPTGEPRWTSYLRNRFLPAPGEGSDLHPAGGMVKLGRKEDGQPVWRLHTLDVDHALRGIAAAAESPGPAYALPALRTAGVLLARVERASELATRGARKAEDALYAEHLTLGYRVDAKIYGQTWHSLCRRESQYAVNGVKFPTEPKEEGHVKIGGGIDRGDNVLRADEVVARWDGWSLAVPRPALRERPPGSTTPSAQLPFVLDTSGIKVEDGTLLRLRFGETYQLRARVADLAGGGPALSEASLDGCDSEAVRFTRHEPVLPPDVRVPSGAPAFGPGASPTALVIRTAEGIADSIADTTRDLVPPSATFEVIERHGRLDGDRALALLARKDLPDPAAGGVVGFVRGEPGEPPRDLEPKDWTSTHAGPVPADPWPDLLPKRVVLRARQGDEPTLDWESDELLVVRLAPAEEATLELSSLIGQQARGAFSISDWLKDDGDGGAGTTSAAEDLLATGRHPMATPVHRLTVRHAVRTPRGTPHGVLEVARDEGSTSGILQVAADNDADRLLGVDPASTIAIDVTASWRPVDDTADPPADRRPVGRIHVGRADTRISALPQEFGDTKHRKVTYTWTALSRFRDCFSASEDPLAFRVEGTLGPVSVPSSARPVAPVVRSVTPAFVWQEARTPTSVVRGRSGNRLRVELATPWFTTGDGEQLAVLGTTSNPPDDVAALVSQAGRDPLWRTGVPPQFFVPVGDVENITLAEGPTVLMVAHGVFEAAGSAFADVLIPFPWSYSALVQLAIARLQRESLRGCEISPVVRTDFVPLLPDRTLTIGIPEGAITVQLKGFAPDGPRFNRVDAVLERRVAAGAASGALTVGEDGTWEQVGWVSGGIDETLQFSHHHQSPVVREHARNAGGELRVRVREVEMIGRDTAPALGTVQELEERVVFTDTVVL